METRSAWKTAPPQARQEFLEDPLFLALQAEARLEREDLLLNLLGKCRVSSDPAVARLCGMYDAVNKILNMKPEDE